MIEPVALKDFFITFFASAMIIITGALYALFYAFYRLQNKTSLNYLAYLSYLFLFIATLTLTQTMNLNGVWTWIIVVMLIAYFLAPRGIWYLSEATHGSIRSDNEK